MPSYSNGYIPTDLLVTFERGHNGTDGHWNHSLSAATYSRHLALVARARARTGRTLTISDGWGAYRPYAAQVIARDVYGNGAAYPGTSSHGGFWEGRQTLAMDYSNWGSVYGWDQGAFFDDCRAVGLTPGMIMRSRGYPDEPWHVIDLDPWSAAPSGVNYSPLEDDMPLTEEDIQRIWTHTLGNTTGVTGRAADWLTNMSDAVRDTPANTWAHRLEHPLHQGVAVPAGDFLRYEPAEHEGTRRAVAAVATGDIDYEKVATEIAERYPQLDPQAFAIAAADEADRRERERLGKG